MEPELTQDEKDYEQQLDIGDDNAHGDFWLLLTQGRIELPPMGLQQALELMSNGDCATDK